jgi:Sensors of blue-light using FAD
MLAQLIYVSSMSISCTQNDIDSILKSSKKNNQLLEVTGILLYSKHCFLQCLEGEYKVLNSLYEIIKKDSRHSQSTVLSLHSISKREFADWQMIGKFANFDTIEFQNEVKDFKSMNILYALENPFHKPTKLIRLIQKYFY